ncbi:hypothetical protein CRUP_011435 [Coryphaenoides rupestris]|nr:hypothetical protein CRUP_011435 [Coryphaenoides rupestris]
MTEEIPRQRGIDPDFEPLSRPRSCTWPLPPPPPRQDVGVEEEDEDEEEQPDEEEPEPRTGSGTHAFASVKQEPGNFTGHHHLALLEETETEDNFGNERAFPAFPEFHALESSTGPARRQQRRQHQTQQQRAEHQQVAQLAPAATSSATAAAAASSCILGGPRKSSSSRRNAWGNMSYADLITKAIDSAPDKRLTLAQIYDWMVKSVPYFKDKGDSNSSAGWKGFGSSRNTPLTSGHHDVDWR